MLIRSQNKTGIVNLNNVDTIAIEDGNIYSYSGIQESRAWLAEYSSKEKAIKALDMICSEYEKYATIKSNDGIKGLFNHPKVFQMPQDLEVEA